MCVWVCVGRYVYIIITIIIIIFIIITSISVFKLIRREPLLHDGRRLGSGPDPADPMCDPGCGGPNNMQDAGHLASHHVLRLGGGKGFTHKTRTDYQEWIHGKIP